MLDDQLLVGKIELGAEKSKIGRCRERTAIVVKTLEGFQMSKRQRGIACLPVYLVSDLVDITEGRNGLGEIDATEGAIKISHGGIEPAALIFNFRFDTPDKGRPAILIVLSEQFQRLGCRVLRVGKLMKLGIDGGGVREDACLEKGALEFGADVERPAEILQRIIISPGLL